MQPIKVVIVDEMPIIRDGLRTFLEAAQDIDVVEVAGSGMNALMLVRNHRPDVVVTGLQFQGMSGVELIRRIVAQRGGGDAHTPRTVAFSMRWSDEVITEVLHAGADGVLMGDAKREEVVSTVRTVARGGTALAPEVAARLVDWFRGRDLQPVAELRPGFGSLTSREREVLTLVGRGLAIDDMAAELSIGVSTIRTHLHRLRNKLDVKDRAQLVSYAYRVGLVRQSA
uniref:LuxR family transcriptional regulator n=1 Tax=Streptomyces sp. SANK 60404 TaxID=1213862 RepID=A0A1B4ZDD6_9ACTN|nr:LuxR family transcriptional regulator [Streptomyces sp. SANK 60404]